MNLNRVAEIDVEAKLVTDNRCLYKVFASGTQ